MVWVIFQGESFVKNEKWLDRKNFWSILTSDTQYCILVHKVNVRWNASCARYQCKINFARKLRISALSWCESFFKAKVLWKMKSGWTERTFEVFWRRVFFYFSQISNNMMKEPVVLKILNCPSDCKKRNIIWVWKV